MHHGEMKTSGDPTLQDSKNEIRAKKSISILDAILISLGFTASNFQHIVTPIAKGGLGLSLGGLSGIVAGTVILGLSTLVITGVISYFLFKLINKNAEESHLLEEKEKEWKEKQVIFFARLIYLRHLLKSTGYSLPYFHHTLQKQLGLDNATSRELALGVDSIYNEEKRFSHVFLRRDARVMSGEKAICDYLMTNSEKYLPKIQKNLHYMDIVHPACKKNWKPELVGAFVGFISFISMSSGFLGAYSSVVTLAMSISVISLAVPILGWAMFGASLIFALVIGLTVRRYTDKSIKRQEIINEIEKQKSKLVDNLGKLHEIEMQLLTEKLDKLEQPEDKDIPLRRPILRSHSWSGGFFSKATEYQLEWKTDVKIEDKAATMTPR